MKNNGMPMLIRTASATSRSSGTPPYAVMSWGITIIRPRVMSEV